jgi:hypothetical protein
MATIGLLAVLDLRRPVPPPRDFYQMPKTERAAAFNEDMEAILSGGADTVALDTLFRNVSALDQKDKLGAFERALATIAAWNAEGTPKLLTRLADEVKTLPPQDEDFDEPTEDQVTALQQILTATATHVAPDVLPAVLDGSDAIDGLRTTIMRTCLGELGWEAVGPWYNEETALDEAITARASDTALVDRLKNIKADWLSLLGSLAAGQPPSAGLPPTSPDSGNPSGENAADQQGSSPQDSDARVDTEVTESDIQDIASDIEDIASDIEDLASESDFGGVDSESDTDADMAAAASDIADIASESDFGGIDSESDTDADMAAAASDIAGIASASNSVGVNSESDTEVDMAAAESDIDDELEDDLDRALSLTDPVSQAGELAKVGANLSRLSRGQRNRFMAGLNGLEGGPWLHMALKGLGGQGALSDAHQDSLAKMVEGIDPGWNRVAPLQAFGPAVGDLAETVQDRLAGQVAAIDILYDRYTVLKEWVPQLSKMKAGAQERVLTLVEALTDDGQVADLLKAAVNDGASFSPDVQKRIRNKASLIVNEEARVGVFAALGIAAPGGLEDDLNRALTLPQPVSQAGELAKVGADLNLLLPHQHESFMAGLKGLEGGPWLHMALKGLGGQGALSDAHQDSLAKMVEGIDPGWNRVAPLKAFGRGVGDLEETVQDRLAHQVEMIDIPYDRYTVLQEWVPQLSKMKAGAQERVLTLVEALTDEGQLADLLKAAVHDKASFSPDVQARIRNKANLIVDREDRKRVLDQLR